MKSSLGHGLRLGHGHGPDPSDGLDELLTGRWIEATIADAFRVDADRIARVRATAVSAHHLAAARADYAAGLVGSRPGLFTAARLGRRAGIVAAALVGVLVVSSVAAAQSGPGQPFYGVRLAAETLTLPPDGTPDGVQARLKVLDERLTEMRAAAKKGDERGAAAALGAYRSGLVQLFPSQSPESVDLHRVIVPGVDLPTVDGRLSDDSNLLQDLQPDLSLSDASTATGVLDAVGRIRAAIADQVARDRAAHDNAGTGDGLGPHAGGAPANGRSTASPAEGASPSPSHRATDKHKHGTPRALPTGMLTPVP
ncbi:MAG TPA: hypothetical protein VF802_06480 [Candidatus Limnocylindrales bacterium]